MYIARFETDTGDWVQGTAGIHLSTARGFDAAGAGWEEFGLVLAAASRIPDATVARRLVLDDESRLRQIISILAPASRERNLRQALALLTRLEHGAGGTVLLPLSREEHDATLDCLPPFRFCTTDEAFSVDGVSLACNFRVAPLLDELLIGACRAGHELSYQLHLRSGTPEAEWLRAARKNVLALGALPGARQTLVSWQAELARGLEQASALCEEYLAVRSEEAAEQVAALLHDRFRAQFATFGFAAPAFDFVRDAHEEALMIGVHTHDLAPLTPIELCGAAVTAAERDRLLGWRPSPRLTGLLASNERDQDIGPDEAEPAPVPVPKDVDLPEPYSGGGSFAFISYKRQDLPQIAPILRQVVDCGFPVWFDRGIPGGAEWDAIIEERLARCRFVLLFTSRAAVESKYVRREVKFADALDTPVLAVLLEDAPLAHGMRMLLTQYQILDARAADFPAQLQRAIARMARS